MRLAPTMVAAVALVVSANPVGAQAPRQGPAMFSGIKLVDLQARKAERTVTVSLDADAMKIVDPSARQEVAAIPYAGMAVTHSHSSAPPTAAGDPSAAATQRGAAPTYMGKTPRHWLTVTSGGQTTVLRVSEKVYSELKAALAANRVEVREGS
jgi:hypothetical protein